MKEPRLQNISPSSWDMKATACSSPAVLQHVAQSIACLSEKNTQTFASPAFSLFSPGFIQQKNISCWRHWNCQGWLWRLHLLKQIRVIHIPQLRLQVVCKPAQCCNTRLALSFEICCRTPGSKTLLFFPWNLRCWKAARGFCQSFPFISFLRFPTSHNTTALTLKLPHLN